MPEFEKYFSKLLVVIDLLTYVRLCATPLANPFECFRKLRMMLTQPRLELPDKLNPLGLDPILFL
jgi:hypothetical protein